MNSKFSITKRKPNIMKNNHIPYITNTLYNNSKKKNKTLNNLNSITLYQNNSSSDKNDKKKLFNSVYSSFNKTSFGSIPYKTENFLINKKLKNPRFSDVKSIFYFDQLRNPGVGKYNLSKDFEITGWDMKFGGYDTRFKTSFNLMPGAGDYDPEENKVLEKNI